MNSVDRVRSILKEKGIPVSKLERDLGYANGYIGQLRKGTFPANRLAEIANYLNVTTKFLLDGDVEEPSPLEDMSEDEMRIIYMYRALSNQGKEYILQQMEIATRVYQKNVAIPNVEISAG